MRTVNVVMLPTEAPNKPSIFLHKGGKLSFVPHSFMYEEGAYTPQHLYFTSDEEIEEGDWYFNGFIDQVHQAKAEDLSGRINPNNTGAKKVVASTDPALLWTDTLHSQPMRNSMGEIPESFILKYIEMYNAGIPITQVQLEEEDVQNPGLRVQGCYFPGDISKRLKLRPDGTVICHPIKEYTFTLEQAVKIFQDGRNAVNYQVVDIESFILNKYSNALLNPQ